VTDKTSDSKERGLKDYGIIYLSGDVDSGASRTVCEEIIEYNILGQVDHIQLIINYPGGNCADGFAIIDLIEWSRLPVFTTGIGLLASMALLIFMAGEKGRRVVTPRTSILSHRFTAFSRGNHSQLLAQRKAEDLEHERIVAHYLRYSGIQSREELEKRLLRDVDTWLSPQEAIQYGLADRIEGAGQETSFQEGRR
jgi:ATP-dependent Clp protease, protease subunit